MSVLCVNKSNCIASNIISYIACEQIDNVKPAVTQCGILEAEFCMHSLLYERRAHILIQLNLEYFKFLYYLIN